MAVTALETVPCALCHSEAYEVVCSAREVEIHQHFLRRFHKRRLIPGAPRTALADRAEFTQDYPTDIVSCCDCGLLFRNPRPSPEAVERMYAQDEYGMSRLEAMFDAQVELYRPKAKMLSRWMRPGARIVEVGSFVGGFLAAGAERGWEMLGVDPGDEVNTFCKGRDLPVFQGSLEDVERDAGSVDAICIWNTFDQIPDPGPTLAAAQRLLRPGGLLALRVPNGECFRWGARWISRLNEIHSPIRFVLNPLLSCMAWNNLLAFPYLNGYSARTLDLCLHRYGLERLEIQTDTLVRLSDEQTQRWAGWEERSLKWITRIAARAEALTPRSRLTFSPWLDAYFLKR